MRVHLVGVAGTGMGQLAVLLRDAGHDVSGSDMAFDPPMGPALQAAGIRCLEGYDAAHVEGDLDLVVVGNAIRKTNPEAIRAEERGLQRRSMSGTLRSLFLEGRKPLVVAGTHGKTTTSAMCAFVLAQAGLEPGWFIGGLPKDLPSGAGIGSTRRKLGASGAPPSPFVVEGDEYDAVYWHKKAKFFDYVGVHPDEVAIVTSIEHDHVDIYPDATSYEAAFAELGARIGERGLVVADARDARVRALYTGAGAATRARVSTYALDGDDTGDVTPTWTASLAPVDPVTRAQPFDVFASGSSFGRFAIGVPGAHNVRNALATLAACTEGFAVPVESARRSLAAFRGVRRRQDLLGTPGGVHVYDDFAHHPTAVDETLRALRSKHPEGRLWAVFEPRSATACRNTHQHEYPASFAAADRVVLAPLGRTNVPEDERLDLGRVAREIGERAVATSSIDEVLAAVSGAQPGDVVALLSNGAFGGVHGRLLAELERRAGSAG